MVRGTQGPAVRKQWLVSYRHLGPTMTRDASILREDVDTAALIGVERVVSSPISA
jgi:hypothetical protein